MILVNHFYLASILQDWLASISHDIMILVMRIQHMWEHWFDIYRLQTRGENTPDVTGIMHIPMKVKNNDQSIAIFCSNLWYSTKPVEINFTNFARIIRFLNVSFYILVVL